MFSIWGNESTIIHLDNGRGFGKAYEDDYTILTGIIHCCLIRETTLKTLLRYLCLNNNHGSCATNKYFHFKCHINLLKRTAID